MTTSAVLAGSTKQVLLDAGATQIDRACIDDVVFHPVMLFWCLVLKLITRLKQETIAMDASWFRQDAQAASWKQDSALYTSDEAMYAVRFQLSPHQRV